MSYAASDGRIIMNDEYGSEISGSRGSEYEDDSLLRYGAVESHSAP
jgi:hypothetical protein